MANVSSTPKLSGMKYRVVSPLGTGAGSTILLISDKTAGGKRYALKVVKTARSRRRHLREPGARSSTRSRRS